jgi:hypothetical protein
MCTHLQHIQCFHQVTHQYQQQQHWVDSVAAMPQAPRLVLLCTAALVWVLVQSINSSSSRSSTC